MKKIVFVLLLILFFQNLAFCICTGPSGDSDLFIEYEYASSDSVFIGKVIDIKVKDVEGVRKEYGEATITFQVLKQFKGLSTEKIEMFDLGCIYSFEKSCWVEDSFIFSKGETYLVYADQEPDGKLGVGGCGRTRLLSERQNDVLVLDKIVATPNWSFGKKRLSEYEKIVGYSLRGRFIPEYEAKLMKKLGVN